MTDNFKKNLRRVIIAIFVIGIVSYGFFQSRNLLLGPRLTIFEPENGAALNRKFIEIRGVAENTSRLSLNGRDILMDTEGDFREKILLSEGYNIYTLVLEDRFGREKREQLELVY